MEENARRRAVAHNLWSADPPAVPSPVAVPCSLCSGETSAVTLAPARDHALLCDACTEVYRQAADPAPLVITRLNLFPSGRSYYGRPAALVAFDPPLVLRLTVHPGQDDGRGPWLQGYEDPDHADPLHLADAGEMLGVNGATRADLERQVATVWGTRYLALVTQAEGRDPYWRDGKVAEAAQESARARLAILDRRVTRLPIPLLPHEVYLGVGDGYTLLNAVPGAVLEPVR